MRPAGNFNPEWGYLAPAPSFMRTVRIVIVATAIGATAGAAVVFSLLDRPVADESVAARTMVPPVASAVAPIAAPAPIHVQAQQQSQPQQASTARSGQSAQRPPASASLARPAAAESSTRSTSERPANVAALAESPAATGAAPGEAPDQIIVDGNAGQKKALKKRTWRGPPRDQAFNRGPLALLRSLTGASRGSY